MDSNFSFLKEVEPELYQLAIVAEDLVHRSPTTAIRELRTFGERIVQRIAEERSVHLAASSQHDRLVELQRHSYIPERISTSLHQIRMQGNDASHENTGSCKLAHDLLEEAWKVACWFVTEIRREAAPNSTYQRPKPSVEEGKRSQRSELAGEVTTGLKALRERLDRMEKRQAPDENLVTRLQERISDLETGSASESPVESRQLDLSSDSQTGSNVAGRRTIRSAGNTLRRFGRRIVRFGGQAASTVIHSVTQVLQWGGRLIRRIVRWTTLSVILGSFLLYLPSFYGWGLQVLPEVTQRRVVDAKQFRSMHEHVVSPEVREHLEEKVEILQVEGLVLLKELWSGVKNTVDFEQGPGPSEASSERHS